MTILHFPLGIPSTGSHAISSSLTLSVAAGGFPTSASISEYAVNTVGPTGESFRTISGSKVVIINL